jgi:hypothetical protein
LLLIVVVDLLVGESDAVKEWFGNPVAATGSFVWGRIPLYYRYTTVVTNALI